MRSFPREISLLFPIRETKKLDFLVWMQVARIAACAI